MESVDLPVLPPIDPMLAKAAARVPDDPDTWSYEPKWDGFFHWTCQGCSGGRRKVVLRNR